MNTEIQFWLINSMFLLGVLIFLLGLWILILPAHFLKAGQSLSKWVVTDQYFDYMDKPRYQEKGIYKYHRIAGALIVLGALYTLVVLLVKIDIGVVYTKLPVVINLFWSEWFYNTVYYLLIGANILAIAVGGIVFVRPSRLKGVEQVLNRWITTGQGLKKLNEVHEIGTDVLPGNPRLFGLAVTLGGVYIMLSMGVMLL